MPDKMPILSMSQQRLGLRCDPMGVLIEPIPNRSLGQIHPQTVSDIKTKITQQLQSARQAK